MAVQRAEDKTAQMQARAGAIDELIASGALDDASSINRGDDISRELEAMSSQADVEAELAALKGGAPGAIDAPQTPAVEAAPQDTVDEAAARPSRAGREGAAGMIVRILGEGQLEVADDQLETLNALDSDVESAVEAGDEDAFAAALGRAARRRTPRRHSRSPRTPSRTPT